MSDSAAAPAVLQALDLHKTYFMGGAELRVLRGASMELRAGEVAALRGASGSGKSTLLHLLGLLDRLDEGEVAFNGRPTRRLSQSARARLRASTIGFVFQQFQLLPELSALENVLVPRRLACGMSWFRRRGLERANARALLGTVGLSDRLGHRPGQLSGGEQQRVAIARALISRPAALLADEPTGNLDRKTGAEVLELLLELAQENHTAVLLATHDPEIAARCSRVLHLEEGRVRQE